VRLVLLFVFIGFSLFGNAQTKKEQIQILSTRLDSLKTVQSIEKQNFENRKKELESSIANSDQKTTELLKTLSTKKENLQNYILENQKLDQDILSLKLELKSIEDSIQAIIDEQPIKLLESSLINISNEELIYLMNVRDEDLGEAFVNPQNPEIKPTYQIIGKQLFKIKGNVYCLVAMGVTNPNTYHASSGTNYIACFEIKDNNWRLEYPAKNTEYIPSVGFGNPAWLEKFIMYGDKSLAIILEGGYTGTGISMGSRAIYGLDDTHKIFLLYNGQSYENDQANKGSNWFQNIEIENNIKLQKSILSKYYDLIETEKSHGKIIKTTILKFNETTMKYE
jgi:hypothetical protein